MFTGDTATQHTLQFSICTSTRALLSGGVIQEKRQPDSFVKGQQALTWTRLWGLAFLAGASLMTLKVGTKGYLKLGDNFEDPHWREALIVAIDGEWLQCLVLCKRLEVDQ